MPIAHSPKAENTTHKMFQSERSNQTLNKILQATVLIYQGLAILVLILAGFLANNWLKTPFLGAFVEHTLVFNGVGPQNPGDAWPILQQGIHFGNQLVSIAGTEVHSAQDIHQVLINFFPGETIPVIIRDSSGQFQTLNITLHAFPQSALISYLVIPGAISLIFLLISLWIFGLRRSESAGRAFSLFASSLAIVSGALFDLYTTHRLTFLWTLALGVSGGALFDLALAFPQEARLIKGRSFLRWIGYAVGAGLVIYAFTTLYNFTHPTAYFRAWQNLYLFVALTGFFFLAMVVYRSIASPSPIVRNQARTILTGTLLAFVPMTLWLLISALRPINFTPYLFVPLIFFPAATGYTILRYRLIQADYLASRTLLYASLTILAALGYMLLVGGVSLIFGTAISVTNPLLIGVMVFVIALTLDPVRTRLQNVIDSIFFRGGRAFQERLRNFNHELTNAVDLGGILQALRQNLNTSLLPDQLHIFLYDPSSDQFTAAAGNDNRPTSDIRFGANSPLVQTLRMEHLPLYVDSNNPPTNLKPEQSRLLLLGAYLFVPLQTSSAHLTGFLALGLRRSGESYSSQELTYLDSISDQAALAIERVQVVVNMQRNVQEMNALNLISQGVNITLTFDDVLELIYAQAVQIIPATDFHITLYNQPADYNYYAFCLENSDRLGGREDKPLPNNQGLSHLIIRTGHAILTQDYVRECQVQSVIPALHGVYAWMGVPLSSGAEVIGALSVGSRDATVRYTQSQHELLQAIANQTAGAIVKARLLLETEKRAHQLATLNEITRQLTSTLELDPLLQSILENAVNILNAEAGSLFLADDETDDLVFRVATGPVADDLIGTRVPAGGGIVGKAAEIGAPIIENDAQNLPDRFPPDDKTDFVYKTILAIPLQVKDRVTGVIEIINRRDNLPFSDDDVNLLTAFASQAAVAIENARLYTLTDQELSARVEELSVMQRIDRELNASLEIDRAMRITLEWAMRQSASDAGLIGILREEGIQIMAEQGYGEHLEAYHEALMPIVQPALQQAIETGQPQRVALEPELGGGILPGTQTQVVVPIRREATVIGLLMMESTSERQIDITFLNRLGDHAAIAISNAQLYEEVQAADVAKSEFVSFVAHELKNPMTSIKGYTELLAAGAVGQINENQANFLHTIRSNVERMSTLVSDLNDNSKIEAGRLRLEYKAVDLDDVVDEVVRSTKRQVEDKKQAIVVQLEDKTSKIWADRTRISQILTNLVSNAHKYTPEGGKIIIGAETSDNQWDPEGADKVVHIWVKDNGIGISQEDQKLIFQKFFRSEDQKAREAPGTGLGLNITKSLVEMQGGKIWFESEYREGTTFHFTAPVAEG
jgi:signal transduction histidine kinase